MSISIIIPAHNEEKRLAATLATYTSALRQRFGTAFEVLVVANGCTDKTAQVALDFSADCPQVKLIDIAAPIGKGGAVLAGFCEASGERILFVDADGATAAQSLFDLLAELDRADVAIGSRWLDGSVVTYPQPLQRRVFSRLFNASVRSLFGLPYHDTQCGAKAFRRAAALQLAGFVTEKRWTFDVDLLVCSRFLGLEVSELPVVWADQAGSKLNVTKTLREVVSALWNMKRRDLRSALASRAYLPEEARP